MTTRWQVGTDKQFFLISWTTPTPISCKKTGDYNGCPKSLLPRAGETWVNGDWASWCTTSVVRSKYEAHKRLCHCFKMYKAMQFMNGLGLVIHEVGMSGLLRHCLLEDEGSSSSSLSPRSSSWLISPEKWRRSTTNSFLLEVRKGIKGEFEVCVLTLACH